MSSPLSSAIEALLPPSSNAAITTSTVTSVDSVTSTDTPVTFADKLTTSTGSVTSADEVPLSRPDPPKPRLKPIWRSPV